MKLPMEIGYKPIEPINIPTCGVASQLYVQANTFAADALNCTLHYYLADESGLILIQGDVQMTNEQFAEWGTDNAILYQIVADDKGLILL